jgi:hypothetical protein
VHEAAASQDHAQLRKAVSRAVADPKIALELAGVAEAVEKRYGAWSSGLGRHVGGSQASLEQHFGPQEGAALFRYGETLRAAHLVQETVREQRTEIVVHQAPAMATSLEIVRKPLVAAVREWSQSVDQVAREQTATHVYHQQGLAELRDIARSVVRQPDKLVAAIDTHIRANAHAKNAADDAQRFAIDNAERLGDGLLGSTKLFDFEGKKERAYALQVLQSLGSHSYEAARAFSHQLEKNRAEETQRRQDMAIEIPALSKTAQSALANLESGIADYRRHPGIHASHPAARRLAELVEEVEANPGLKAEFDAYTKATRARFGDTDIHSGRENMKTRLAAEDQARQAEILRPANIIRDAKLEIVRTQQAEQAAKQGLSFGM